VPVNTVPGVMGAGMAKEAAERAPSLKESHAAWCRGQKPVGGDVRWMGGQVLFVATKQNWRAPSRVEWIERGLRNLRKFMDAGTSVALPLLGCGRGGLDPTDVERLIVTEFGADPERLAEVYRD
jgi:hypothetical protein